MPVNPRGFKTLYRIKYLGGGQPNPSNLKTKWEKTRAYVGVSPKCGLIRQMLISSLTITLCILTEPLVCTCVILNGPNFLLLICGSFRPL